MGETKAHLLLNFTAGGFIYGPPSTCCRSCCASAACGRRSRKSSRCAAASASCSLSWPLSERCWLLVGARLYIRQRNKRVSSRCISSGPQSNLDQARGHSVYVCAVCVNEYRVLAKSKVRGGLDVLKVNFFF